MTCTIMRPRSHDHALLTDVPRMSNRLDKRANCLNDEVGLVEVDEMAARLDPTAPREKEPIWDMTLLRKDERQQVAR